jgi:hypothetical protein
MVKSVYGILDDEKLEMCYKGILDDVQALVDEGWVRVVEYTDMNVRKLNAEKKRTFFPCNLANTEVEIQVPDKCKEYISDLWGKIQ